jgi:hypothetical protein
MIETDDLVEEELIKQLKEQKMRTGLYPYYSPASRHLNVSNVLKPTQIVA